ncbi:MAG: HAD family phosphatase [Nitrososphaera sp.]|nr:HAD family phosphatase [Nitrososphaera sp.]
MMVKFFEAPRTTAFFAYLLNGCYNIAGLRQNPISIRMNLFSTKRPSQLRLRVGSQRNLKLFGSVPETTSKANHRENRKWLAVCFDMDGVVLDTMPLHALAWQQALASYGLRVSRRSIYEWEGEPGEVTARRLLAQGNRASSLIEELLRDKERRFKQLARYVKPHPRIQTLLDLLSQEGMGLSLVTGTSWSEVRRIVSATTLKKFDVLVTGDRVRRGKPHPEPYLTALCRLRVPAKRAIVVENAPNGIHSARRAGVGLVIALASSLPPSYLKEAHIVVTSVTRLCRLLLLRTKLTIPSPYRYNNRGVFG